MIFDIQASVMWRIVVADLKPVIALRVDRMLGTDEPEYALSAKLAMALPPQDFYLLAEGVVNLWVQGMKRLKLVAHGWR